MTQAPDSSKNASSPKIIYLIIIILLVIMATSYYFLAGSRPVKVGVLVEGENTKQMSSAKLAFEWLTKEDSFEPVYLPLGEITVEAIAEISVLWFHKEDTLAFNNAATKQTTLNLLASFIEGGGKLLLSQEAALFITKLGLETNPPNINYIMAEDGGYGRKMGLHSFLQHPVFNGLHGGAFIFGPQKDVNCRQIGYFGDNIPQKGKTIAVDWAYIQLKEKSRLMLEFDKGEGKVISIGSYMLLGMLNQQQEQMDRFIANTLNYLNHGNSSEAQYWSTTPPTVKADNTILEANVSYQQDSNWLVPELKGIPQIYSQTGGNNYMEVSGKRMLIMGQEKGGIEEVWAHPFMALRDYEVGISFSEEDSIFWLSNQEPEIWSYPGIFLRQYKFRRAYLREWISASPIKSQAIIRYEYRGVYPAKFHLRFRSNLRRMWPYSEETTGDISYQWDDDAQAFLIKNELEDMITILGSSKQPDWKHLGDAEQENKIPFALPYKDSLLWGFSGAASYSLEMNENFYFVLSATSEGMAAAKLDYLQAFNEPQKIFEQSKSHSQEIINKKLVVESPDSAFNLAYKWALLSTDKFLVETPGLGQALVAGYASSAHGWDGAQKVSGRPGYAWYFGRDGQWSGMALLDYGDFEAVRKQLEFYLKFQGVNGKIFHEVSTSGVVHYDAADATPLFIVLAGKYLKHSGDVDFIRQNWPQIEHALSFCYSTDTNNDKLIENANVGHGWVEGGGLYGSQTTLYLASSWAAALAEAAYMAKGLGKTKLEEKYNQESVTISRIINDEFWNKESNFFNHGKYPDGSYNKELTVMSAIPIYFGQVEQDKISQVIKQFAGNGFSSDWGVRIVPETSRLFNPHGYHTGSVWPLYTGWTALAEYEGGNYNQGFQHIMNNLNIYKYWGSGYIEEVLDGLVYQPSGVCRHQCWSETMALQPLIEGMLGFRPDALDRRIELSPRLPAQWDSFKVDNLRIGSKNISMDMTRNGQQTIYAFKSKEGNEILLEFNPVFSPGTEFEEVKWKGKSVEYELVEELGGFIRLELDLNLTLEGRLIINHSGGIVVLPLVPKPKPGNTSRGFRLLKHQLISNEYKLTFEGKSGNSETFKVYCPQWQVVKVTGAELVSQKKNVYTYNLAFATGSGYRVKEINILIEK